MRAVECSREWSESASESRESPPAAHAEDSGMEEGENKFNSFEKSYM